MTTNLVFDKIKIGISYGGIAKNMKKKKLISLVLCLALLFSFAGCEKEQKITAKGRSFSELYFDTYGSFSDYTGSSQKDFDKLFNRVQTELSEYHKLYDIYHEYEGMVNLKTINDNAGCGKLTVDEKIIDLLLYAKEMHELTDGKINIAFGSVLKIWHNYREKGVAIPTTAELTAANAHTSIENLVIDEENNTVELLDPEMSLDVGAIAKGYAVEKIAEGLIRDGYSGYALDVGGNLRTIGKKPNGQGWTVGIKNPTSPYSQTYVYTTEIKNCAIVTSGNYERFYTVAGVRYHHIINPESLFPENYYLSVSVKSGSSALSDALSTALFNTPYEEISAFVKSLDGVFVVVVLPDGTVECITQ